MASSIEDISSQVSEKLTQIGFTQLESETYLFLLINGSNTGYSIAKGIGKPVANVYKAVESLSRKGAIESSVAESKQCTAVPWEQFLSIQQKSFINKIETLSECLKQLPLQQQDEKVYQLNNTENVIAQSIRIIDESEEILLADIEPDAMEWLQDSLEKAAHRGVDVRVKVYTPINLKGVKITLRQQGEQIYQKTQDIAYSLCADGKESIIALVTSDKKRIIQAFRTQSALMNMSIYNGLLYGLILTELKIQLPKGDLSGAQKLLAETEHLHPFSAENKVFTVFRQGYINRR
ncbi:TrmB family transcriptional regulator [Aliikangiella coralliicola]|uniref:TrmB family transcriptional regulator n=1 Tax=Aliikangiella coralliicola TaxID=2592383 RepID=A0A545UFT3_9GAMM|nr:helix-turn-helix domain-containing protein [Aliikangiella coralliicola]TQV88327.1 hypothetical protein FLL46_07320 [Aliikangiella coralliicola]